MPSDRSQPSRVLCALLMGLVVLTTVVPAGAIEGLLTERWIEVRSPNATLITDADSVEAVELVRSLEALRSAAADLFGDGEDSASVPTTIVLFAEESTYAPFRVAAREGQFFPTAYESLIILNGGADGRPLRLAAAHEYLHALLAAGERRLPLWLHEGLAEYYSTFCLEAGQSIIGRPVPGHRARLRHRAFSPFAKLAAVGSRSPDYYGAESLRFYAQSWLTVHYLMSTSDGVRGLLELAEAVDEGADVTVAFGTVFGRELDDLDAELRRYLNRSSLPYSIRPLEPSHQLFEPRIEALETRALAYRLGVVASEQAKWSGEQERFDLAGRLLEVARVLGPADGDAYAGQARLEEAMGDPDAAARLFERAVYLDALEARSYAHYAEFLLHGSVAESSPGWARERARQMLERALEIAPGHSRLQTQLGGLLAGSGGDSQVGFEAGASGPQ